MNKNEMVVYVLQRLESERARITEQWHQSTPVRHFVVDNLLPEEVATQVASGFPKPDQMRRFDTIRERKSSSADHSKWGEKTRDAFFALQDEKVLEVMASLTGIPALIGDPSGYAGGISLMGSGDFLNPHLDNSTHPKIEGYRRLNALFYVTPGWKLENGGNLELWNEQLTERLEVCSSFNRLVVMNTNRESLHSVNRVMLEGSARQCVSNYYFTSQSPHGFDYHHVTSFRGRPGEPLKDLYLRAEGALASFVQSIMGTPLK